MSVSNSRVHEKTHCPALAVVAVVGNTAVDEAGIARAIVYPAQDLHSLVKGQMRSIRHLVQRRLLQANFPNLVVVAVSELAGIAVDIDPYYTAEVPDNPLPSAPGNAAAVADREPVVVFAKWHFGQLDC